MPAKSPLKSPKKYSKVVIGMSGGVDSSVAAWMLKEQGYEVIGLFMKNWEDDDNDEYCSSRQDWLDVVSVADLIGIDVEAVNFAAEYRERVFAEFLREYAAGRTPNPDVLCNAEIKFKAFLDHAMSLGADAIATGHYARVRHEGDKVQLLKAIDASKDQSYFLHRLTQQQLANVLFPLGEIPKTEVRQIAEKIGLHNAGKKDSTGICFIGERPFREFLQKYMPIKPGKMVASNGKIMGEHMGLMYYTIGQRSGLGIGGPGEPWFVADKNLETNELLVVQGHNAPELLKQNLTANELNFSLIKPVSTKKYSAKTRYRMQDACCVVDYIDDDTISVIFDKPQWAITPGQSIVVYDGEICLGGGIIT